MKFVAVNLVLACIGLASSNLIRNRRQNDNIPCEQADLAFVLDVSNSIGYADFKKEIQFVEKIIDLYEVGQDRTRVAALTFGNRVDVEFNFNSYQTKDEVLAKIRSTKYGDKGQSTRTYSGLKKARRNLLQPANGARAGVPDIVVVITDGETNRGNDMSVRDDKKATQDEASLLRGMGATVFTIGVGPKIDPEELKGIAGDAKRYLQAKSYDELNTAVFFNEVKYKVCKDVEPCKNKNMDIAFILDGSSSLRSVSNFRKELSFVSDVVDTVHMANGETQVSIVKFSDDSKLEIPFNMYHNRTQLKERIQRIKYEGGNTYMDKAFNMLIDQVFTQKNGARPGIEKAVVMITDGQSTTPQETKVALKRVKDQNLNMFAIGVGPEVSMDELKKIASTPSQAFFVSSVQALDVVQGVLHDKLCSNPITTVCSQQPSEIVFILDASTSLTSKENFYKELSFVAGLTDSFAIGNGPQQTRFAVITFSDDAKLEFGLSSSTSKEDLQNKIFNIDYMMGNTYTNKAIDLMLREGFAGARPNIPKIGVVITDGGSTDPMSLKNVLAKVQKTDIHMMAIGVGDSVNLPELENIASDANHVFPVVGIDALKFVEEKLITTVCEQSRQIMNTDLS